MMASASAFAADLAPSEDEVLELTEHDLWEDNAGALEDAQSASSAPSFSFEHSSDSDAEDEAASPDIKAFHGESTAQHPQLGNAEADLHSSPDATPFGSHTQDNTAQSLSPQHSTDNIAQPVPAQQSTSDTQHPPSARQSIDDVSRHSTEGSARQSFESASAMPISASVASHRMRRPPLRASSTFADMDGLGRPRAAVKMGSSAPINIPLMSRLHFKDSDDDDHKKPAPFVPPHLLTTSNDPVMQQQHSIFTGESLGSSVRREKLQQRNAILRRTGFLEGPARVKGVAEVMDPIKESLLEKDGGNSSSALTAALGSSPSVNGR